MIYIVSMLLKFMPGSPANDTQGRKPIPGPGGKLINGK